MKYYIAGGAVRDLLLGRPLHDIDTVFDASEDEFIQRNPAARKIGTSPCPIYLLHGREFTPASGGSPAQDVLRRDFTINAMSLSPEGVIFAHPLSFSDLQQQILRPASPQALAADPVRAFRAARFFASLPEFSVHEDCLAQMRGLAQGSALAGIAAERVGREICKACLAVKPGNFLRLLSQGACLFPWFAEFVGAENIPAGPPAYHDSSVLEHTCRVMDATAALAAKAIPVSCTGEKESAAGNMADSYHSVRSLAVWMALCHDLGKMCTPHHELPQHKGHETVGEGLALALGTRLRLSRRMIKAGELAAKLHMKGGAYHTLRPGTKVDLLTELHAADALAPFFLMVAADAGREDLADAAKADCEHIMRVSLPEEWRNRGEESGKHLRDLRCGALTKTCLEKFA